MTLLKISNSTKLTQKTRGYFYFYFNNYIIETNNNIINVNEFITVLYAKKVFKRLISNISVIIYNKPKIIKINKKNQIKLLKVFI